MYKPKYTETDNDLLAFELIKKFPLGLLISNHQFELQTGYYPFFVSTINEKNYLVGHMAKSNPQWKAMNQKNVMVSFQGPNRYISPTIYEKSMNVPTWSYAVVQIHGSVELIQDENGIYDLLNESVGFFETENQTNWKYDLPAEMRRRLQMAIVGFRISVDKIDAKLKLSQNRDEKDYFSVLNHVKRNLKPTDHEFYQWMLKTDKLR